MSTPCIIAELRVDGSVRSVYCHWDGYPAGVGLVLVEHYRYPLPVQFLVDGGDLSTLAPHIGGRNFPHPGLRDESVCLYAYRDCGERWEEVRPLGFPDTRSFLRAVRERYPGAAWIYMFDHGLCRWFARKVLPGTRIRDDGWEEVHDIIVRQGHTYAPSSEDGG